MRQKAMEADIVVVNHHLFFADLSIRKTDMAAILPDYSAVIFDEAHELEDIATEYFGFHVSNFRHCRNSFTTPTKARSRTSRPGVARVGPILQRLCAAARRPASGSRNLKESSGLIGALQDARSAIQTEEGFFRRMEALARRAGEIADRNSKSSAAALSKTTFRGSSGADAAFSSKPVRSMFPACCRKGCSREFPSCVLTSATLTVAESFEYIRARIGMNEGRRTERWRRSSTFASRRCCTSRKACRTIVIRHTWIARWRRSDDSCAHRTAARSCCSPAISRWKRCMSCSRNDLPYPCLVQGKGGGKSRLLEEFKITPNAVLFATSSFWQGVDVKGEALSAVIIDKLPFQVPSDPLVARAHRRTFEREGGNAFSEYQVPNAILRLKQGFGRLIRSTSDRGILAILDNRLSTKGYGKLFMASLPDYEVTENSSDLVEFMGSAYE